MSDLYGRPSAAELVEAVKEFLAESVLSAVSSEHAFKLRVAVNALGMVERELRLGPDEERAHMRRLAKLGFVDSGSLAAAIRAGTSSADSVRAGVLTDVEARLRVSNPTFAEEYDD